MEVRITGMQELQNALQNVGRGEILLAADRGLKKGGMAIVAEAQDNLRRNGTNTTGLLSQSGKVRKSSEGEGYDAGFMQGEKNYAGAVEYGRRAGRMPPPDMLDAWAYKKMHLHDRKASRTIGWAIAKHIAKNGTRPHPFFAPAVQKYQPRILNIVRDEIAKVVNRNV
ncbi:MAG: HK97-gp10 family putative phage morphogenesis protein [Bacteroidales bacterium]|nr:HK97-gp10 family putative phage morphogenesis protein [Bacteroidales bacterium]